MKKELKFLNYVFYSIAFFILLPNNLKEVPFAILGVFAIFLFAKEKKINTKEFLLLTSFFSISVLSLLYCEDLKYGFNRIEGLLPFLYLTFSYSVFSKMEIRFDQKFVHNWISIFNISNFLFLIIFGCYFYYQGVELNYNNIRTLLDQIPFINIHPIYLSITTVLGLMTCVYIFRGSTVKSLIFIIGNTSLLVLSGARATFIGFLILLFLFILFSKIDKRAKISLGLVSFISLFLLFTFNSDFKKRFREMILPVSYSTVDPNNSTSVRYAVWNCSRQQIKNSDIILGNGIGDVPTILQECYDAQYPELGKYYNTHNQYFSILLGTGLIGLISFLLFFVYLFIYGLKNKNIFLGIVIVFYLYMFIFENIMERKYGILLLLFFLLYVFNIFIRTKEEPN
jgi:O-antigen ligase